VDSGKKLIASQAALGADLPYITDDIFYIIPATGRIFNHLSDGNLPQVIPEAPTEPIYSKIGVIK
jgi:hypothetical protein